MSKFIYLGVMIDKNGGCRKLYGPRKKGWRYTKSIRKKNLGMANVRRLYWSANLTLW